MMPRHMCLNGVPGLGDEFDCGACRASLLEAFREPVRSPETAPRPLPPQLWEPSLAHGPAHPPGDTCVPGGMHDMVSAIDPPLPGSNLGTWSVICNCGFKREGSYLQPHIAQSIVSSWVEYHVKHPEDRGDGRT